MNGWQLFYIIVLGVGAVQGIVMGGLLWSKAKPRYYANRFLAALLFFFSYRLAAELLAMLGVLTYTSPLYHILIEFNWVYGGLLYFYVKSYLNPNWRLQRHDATHLLPVVIEFVLSNYVKVQNFYWDGTPESLSWLGYWSYVAWNHTPFQVTVFCGLMIFYGILALKEVKKAVQEKERWLDGTTTWLQQVLWIYMLFSVLALFFAFVDYLFFDYAFQPFYIYPLYAGMAILTYGLGLIGFAHRNDALPKAGRIDVDALVDVDQVLAELKTAMEQRHLYRNPTLTLNELAQDVEVKPYVLTQVLNSRLKKSFNDYVNSYRIEEVLRLMKSPDHQAFTLTALAFEAGFNSKATFNRIFRKITGKTPSEMKKAIDGSTI